MTSLTRTEPPKVRTILATIESFDVMRLLLGVILLMAAGLKYYQLATEPMPVKSIFTSRWFLIAEVDFEIVLGISLLSGLYKRLVWLVTLACFVTFSFITLYKGLCGEMSCGCLGGVRVSPWYTFLFDLSAVLLLIFVRPHGTGFRGYRSASTVALICVLTGLLAPLTSYAISSYGFPKSVGDGLTEYRGNYIMVDPKQWIGKHCPLLELTDIGRQLNRGGWIVIFYRYDCPHCQEYVPTTVQMTRQLADQGYALHISLVEVPPYAEANHSLIPEHSLCLAGRLSQEKQWYIQTPLVIAMVDGIVTKTNNNTPQDLVDFLAMGGASMCCNENRAL